MVLRPDVLRDLAANPEYLNNLKRLEYVMNVACALPREIGDKVAEKVPLTTHMGSTETLLVPWEIPKQDDWEYCTLSDIMGAEFRHCHEDLYELVIVRNPTYELCQPIFFTFPHLNEYSMKDLYSRHPKDPDLWRYRGRVDDVIQFSNGKKFFPLAMEEAVSEHPKIASVVALGQARTKPVLVLEPRYPGLLEDAAALLEQIWPTVEAANEKYQDIAKVSKNCVLFTKSSMQKTAKGQVQRLAMSNMYKDDSDKIFGASGERVHGLQLLVAI